MYTITGVNSIENVRDYFPELLYKYRDWSSKNSKTIITNQQVYFAPPKAFSDRYDCRFPVDWDFRFKTHRPALEGGFPYDRSNIPDKVFERILKNQHKRIVGNRRKRKKYIGKYSNNTNHHLGILSLTARNDNLKIWHSDYAVNFKGFCVGINFKDCLQELMDAHIGGGRVIYVDRSYSPLKFVSIYSSSDKTEAMALHLDRIHLKYDKFKFEEEYRLVQRYYGPQYTFLGPIDWEHRLFTVPKRCFKTVTFGCKMPLDSRKEIVKACVGQELNIDFYQASPLASGMVLIEKIDLPTVE